MRHHRDDGDNGGTSGSSSQERETVDVGEIREKTGQTAKADRVHQDTGGAPPTPSK